jgi:hypothetical protein
VTQRKIPGKTVEVLDDEDVRRRVLDGELVAMPALGAAAVDPLVMKRLRELARRSLRGRGSPQS